MAELTELRVCRGDTLRVLATITGYDPITSQSYPLDITDCNIYGSVRENYTTDELAAQFNIIKNPPYNSGSFFYELAPAQTILLDQRKYVYDVIVSSGSINPVTKHILEGPLLVRPTVSR